MDCVNFSLIISNKFIIFIEDFKVLLMSFNSGFIATKWHNMNNRGCKPTAICNLSFTALKGLNISLVTKVCYSTPPGLREGLLSLPWVTPTVIHIKPSSGFSSIHNKKDNENLDFIYFQ